MTVMNATGMRYVATGDYFPRWLRCFVTALVDPVPNAAQFVKPTGIWVTLCFRMAGSKPELHGEFMLGVAPAQQINFTDVDCTADMKRIPVIACWMQHACFDDYQPFRKLKFRKLTHEMTQPFPLR